MNTSAQLKPVNERAVWCRDVVKEFGKGETRTRVLHGVGLEVRAGEMTFLVGPSGCGKTTLISIIGGILTPESGEVEVFGTSLRQLSRRALAHFRLTTLGFIFQQFNLLPALTAVENAAVPLIASGVRESKARSKAAELLEKLGMRGQLKKLPTQLSGGQQQRVAIARALCHEPRLVICDEPTASLDAQSGHTVMELLRESALQPDRGVIVVTHDNRIYSFADTIAHMSDGRIERVERTSDVDPRE